jgi:signal transduction histidine kinase/CheY-like chemotaxis protein
MHLPTWWRLRNLTVQGRIVLLVIACILPAWLLAGRVTYLYYERERDGIIQHALERARGVMRVVETDLAANQAALQALATSTSMDRGDFAAFYRRAQEVLIYTSGFTIVLSDPSGQQIVNLLQPFGSPLPRHGNPEQLRRALATQRPVVSDVYIGGVTEKPVVGIEVPVIRDGKALYGLALGLDPKHLADILRQQNLPPEWVVSIFDSTGTTVARDRAAEQFMGRKGAPLLVRRMQEVAEGTVDTPTLEGIPVVAVFSRSTNYGWAVAVGIPEDNLTAELKRWVLLYSFSSIPLLLLGLALAIVIGRSITRPVQALIAPALRVGKGEPASIPPLGLKEADEVRQALLDAEQLLRQRERERDEAEKAEREMQLAKQVAERANEAKAVFLAKMSHELRTPLNAILGFSRLMRNGPAVTAEQARNLDIINRSGEHLLNLINNLLDISKIEAGHVETKETDLDLHGLLHEIQSLLTAQAVEKGLRLVVEFPPNLPRHVAVDAEKLRQVLINLVANAIKFTREGGVFLRAGIARQESPQLARVRFEVEDTGPAIDEADRDRIFLPFVQLGDEFATTTGTGLGLFISKQFVELMGGQIGVITEPGKRLVLHFEIPVRITGPSGEDAGKSPSRRVVGLAPGQPRHRLLIAEDQPEDRLLLRKLLEPLGFDLRDAANGHELVALFQQWQPHLIWMDIRMPVADGLEATRIIRAREAGIRTKIVAVTAHALDDERRQILTAGCDDIIRKPYRETEIFDALERYLGVRFLYSEDKLPAAAAEAVMLNVEELQKLPPRLLEALHEAAVHLDGERCLGIAVKIGAIEHEVGGKLQRMVKDMQYRELLALMDAVIGKKAE